MPLTLDDKTAADLTALAKRHGFDDPVAYLHDLIDTDPPIADTTQTPPKVLTEVRRRQEDDLSDSLTMDEFKERIRERFYPDLTPEQLEARLEAERRR